MKSRIIRNEKKILICCNLAEAEYRAELEAAAKREGFECRYAAGEELNKSVSELCEQGAAEIVKTAEPSEQKAIIIAGANDREINRLIKAFSACPWTKEIIKAAVTPTNRSWSAAAMISEISAEHAAMTAGKGSLH